MRFEDGSIRCKFLDGVMRAGTRTPGAPLIVGAHGTSLAGIIGMMRDTYVKKQEHWQVIFFMGVASPRSLDDVRELIERARDNSFWYDGIGVELHMRCNYEKLSCGGHEDEAEVCRTHGACFYRPGDSRRKRWTCREDVAEIRAIWIMADSAALAQAEQYAAFSL